MVAAAKLRRAQECSGSRAALLRAHGRRYWPIFAGQWPMISERAKAVGGHRLRTRPILLIVATAERGLCGGFNSSIAKLARDHARRA